MFELGSFAVSSRSRSEQLGLAQRLAQQVAVQRVGDLDRAGGQRGTSFGARSVEHRTPQRTETRRKMDGPAGAGYRHRGMQAAELAMAASWVVYVLVSRTRGTYVGISTDAERRLREHNGERAGGARCTRAGRPWNLAAVYGPYASRGEALSVEHQVKQLRGRRRLGVVA